MDEIRVVIQERDFKKLVAGQKIVSAGTRVLVDAGSVEEEEKGRAAVDAACSSSVKSWEARVVVVLSDIGFQKMREAVTDAQCGEGPESVKASARNAVEDVLASLTQAFGD